MPNTLTNLCVCGNERITPCGIKRGNSLNLTFPKISILKLLLFLLFGSDDFFGLFFQGLSLYVFLSGHSSCRECHPNKANVATPLLVVYNLRDAG